LRSWAYCTSPYGLNLSSRQSWNLTPREVAALESVFAQTRDLASGRWALERAHFFNANFKHPQQKQWTSDDFWMAPGAQERKRQLERDASGLAAAQASDRMMSAMIAEAQKDHTKLAALDSQMPAWARMTPDEKRARGL
jgi:hypothetical protein